MITFHLIIIPIIKRTIIITNPFEVGERLIKRSLIFENIIYCLTILIRASTAMT